jgi:hypothetical protein
MKLKHKTSKGQIKVKLTANGKALGNKNVNFYVKGKYIGYNTTNSKGIALFKYNPKKVDEGNKLKVTTTFPGDTNYLTISKSAKIKFNNKKTKEIS